MAKKKGVETPGEKTKDKGGAGAGVFVCIVYLLQYMITDDNG